MNIQRRTKPPVIHGVFEVLEDKGVAVTFCSKWLDWDTFKVVTGDVTCKQCLLYLKGGLTVQERSRVP